MCRKASFLLIVLSLLSGTAFGADRGQIRLLGNFGPWIGRFSQSDSTNSMSLTSTPMLGLQTQLGFRFSIFFIEYSFAWGFPVNVGLGTPGASSRDARYTSWVGGNAGLALPFLPFEFYGGAEKSGYSLSGGLDPDYGGIAGKVGVNFIPVKKGIGLFGLKAEYRRIFLSSDNAGALPDTVNTRAETFFVGFTFGIG